MNEPIVQEVLLDQIVDLGKDKLSLAKLKSNMSEYQLCYLIFKGAYSILAHKKAQRKTKEQMRDAKAVLKIVRENPELAEQCGLGTRA